MKQPFTIGGSVPLKKALLEETGAKPCDALSLNYQYLYIADYTNCIGGANKELPINYQLPQDWDKAVAAVKDFFAEEPKEEAKPETLVLKGVGYVDKANYHKRIKTDFYFTAEHIQQLKAYFNS
jgi:hypothetical protein